MLAQIMELEAENLALRIERERLREMVARYADVAATEQTTSDVAMHGIATYLNEAIG
jgi:regulator of replication initiation timing